MYEMFNEILEWIKDGIDIDFYMSYEYYKSILSTKWINIKSWSIYHELVFIKYVKKKYNIDLNEINWIYKEDLVIFNEELLLYKDWKWKKINDEPIHIVSVKLWFDNPFWYLLKKLPNVKAKFTNNYDNYQLRWDKLDFIIDIYDEREKYIWDFMLPSYVNRSLGFIQRILLLRKEKTWKDNVVIKQSYLSDNWKDIKLLKIDDFVNRNDLLDYLYIKYISKVWFNRWSVYFIDFYDIKKEYRFYVNKTSKNRVKIFYVKLKKHFTLKDELYNKTDIRVGTNMKITWESEVLKNISKDIKDNVKNVMKKIKPTAWAIEFIEEKNWNFRFLEINDLWDTLLRDDKLDKEWEKWITSIIDNLFK